MPASKSAKRELPPEKAKREAKLQDMLTKLKAGEHVQNRRLQKWLLPEEIEELQSAWETQKAIREELAEKPAEIERYSELLKQADFLHSRAEGYSTSGNGKSATKFFNQAETAYERALEHLAECIGIDPELRKWIDRDLDWAAGGMTSTDPDSVPRIIMSRSRRNASSGIVPYTQSKRDVKIGVVERALEKIHPEPVVDSVFQAWLRDRSMPSGKSPEEQD